MELSDLDTDERIALAGLIKVAVLADGRASADEGETVQEVVDALGEESYRQALDAFESRFTDEPSFRRFLETINRKEARELIYGTILDAAVADAVEGSEPELLPWLEQAWNVEVTVGE